MPMMTYEEYAKTEHSRPYTYVIKSRAKALFYFGESHSFDPSDSQWSKVKDLWKAFMDFPAKKRVVLVEGGVRDVWSTEKEAVLKDGGMGLATYLAAGEGIDRRSPEPDRHTEIALLEREFPRDSVDYYYFARDLYQWQRQPKPKLDPRTHKKFVRMKAIHKALFGRDLEADLEDEDLFYDLTDPTREDGAVTNAISRRSSEIRDEHIAREIQRLWDDGYSIFAQYGATHVIMQEPLLREVLK